MDGCILISSGKGFCYPYLVKNSSSGANQVFIGANSISLPWPLYTRQGHANSQRWWPLQVQTHGESAGSSSHITGWMHLWLLAGDAYLPQVMNFKGISNTFAIEKLMSVCALIEQWTIVSGPYNLLCPGNKGMIKMVSVRNIYHPTKSWWLYDSCPSFLISFWNDCDAILGMHDRMYTSMLPHQPNTCLHGVLSLRERLEHVTNSGWAVVNLKWIISFSNEPCIQHEYYNMWH